SSRPGSPLDNPRTKTAAAAATAAAPPAASARKEAVPVGAVTRSTWLLDSERNRRVVDGLRAIGIILVIAFHSAFVFAKILPRPKFDAFVATMPGAFNVVWQALGSEVVFFSSGFLLSYL